MDTPLTVKVKDEKKLIEEMKNTTSFFSHQTITEYMSGYAQRAAMLGFYVDTTSHKSFVESLIKAGYIKEGSISLSKK